MNENLEVRLLKREEHTLYVDISLGEESPARPMTGIFIPENYVPQRQVDLILYLHGYKNIDICGPDESVSIDGYWSSAHWPLREETNRGGKNAILVAPTLGPKSQAGRLIDARGFEAYVTDILTALRKYGPYQTATPDPECGHFILACHSGGGEPMRKLALGNHRYADYIRECWGFDCLYGSSGAEQWAKWAEHHQNAKLFIHYLHTTEAQSKDLKDKHCPNVFVQKSSADNHCVVPREHWLKRMKASAVLRDK